MENILIYPKNKKQESLLKSLLEEMKVRFDVVKEKDVNLVSEEEFYKKIERSLEQAEDGKATPLPKDKQKDILGL